MIVNYKKHELQIKIVYYGAALAGKTTNLQKVFDSVPAHSRSDLVTMDTQGDRTLFFDYLQMAITQVGRFTPRLNLYTVPGQVIYNTTRRVVLQGADAVIFVADSDISRMDDNRVAWFQLMEHLRQLGLNGVPIVLQWNKRDLPNAASLDDLRMGLDLTPGQFLEVEAVAVRNIGVRRTLERTVRMVLRR